jgi:hypothetical protein
MKKRKFNDGGIYTAEMGKPPQDIDGASVTMKKPMAKPPMAMKKPMPKKPMMPMAPTPRNMPSETPTMPGMKKGGSTTAASKRANGVAVKGKTKGTQVKMKSGGRC